MKTDVAVDAVMAELQGRVRERLREQLLRHGASRAFEDPALFAEVERLLQSALAAADSNALVLPDLLGDPETWRLETAMRHQSHRSPGTAAFILFIKRRILSPLLRWLFEYSRDNFERQRRVNQVLFACVQELAIEMARLREEAHRTVARETADSGARHSEARPASDTRARPAEARGASEGG